MNTMAFGPSMSPARIARNFALAVSAAEDKVGATAPNPPVGCVLMDASGRILASAAHARAGEPHAEAAALAACEAAGRIGEIHTALVTLEPCSHQGRTPPCVDALLRTPVRAVWIGALDPHPRGPGAGARRLVEAGIATAMIGSLPHPDAAALSRAADALVAPFGKCSRQGRPWVVVKAALTADGDMIPPPGQKTFTSAQSLLEAHRLRRSVDAIITGSGTVLADNPAFTVRHLPDHPDKRRRLAILDRRGRVSWFYVRDAEQRGFQVTFHDDIPAMLDDLGASGVLRALVEAGPSVRRAFLDQGLWDEEIVFRQSADPDLPDMVGRRVRPLY
jgi:diaminohydroxyphosphoribosylaminopyrimidine deaminase/5-amino-6-(5-phosphoribosylamino)uracil reductase